jgi:hypothetical protein
MEASSHKARGGCSEGLLFGTGLAWSQGVALVGLAAGISLAAFASESSSALAFMAVGRAVLVAVPLGLLSLLPTSVLIKNALRGWAAAAAFSAFSAPFFLTAPYKAQLHASLHMISAGLFTLLVLFLAALVGNIKTRPAPGRAGSIWLAVAAASLFATPWLAWGALGSPADLLLQLLAGLSLGCAAGLLLELFIFRPAFRQANGSSLIPTRQRMFYAGFTGSVTLLLFFSGTGFGYSLMQLLLVIALPGLAYAAAGLAGLITQKRVNSGEEAAITASPINRSRWFAAALLVGLSASAPMLLIDPAELILLAVLGPGELLQWALAAALISAVLGYLAGAGLIFLAASRPFNLANNLTARILPPLLAGLILSGGFLIYFLIGQPGFHGDGLFVILEDQLDTLPMASIQDPWQRRQAVYHALSQHARASQAELHQNLDRFQLEYRPYYLVNGLEVRAGPLVRAWLATHPAVDRVLYSPWMRPLPDSPRQSTGSQPAPNEDLWNLEMIRAPQVWREYGLTGEGIIIGHSDSGVQWDHPELADSYRGLQSGQPDHSYNWYDPWYGSSEPVDFSGHGTHTLGIIVGQNTGVAPGAQWFACANLTRNLGSPALYLECMQFMLAPFPQDGDPMTDGRPDLGAHILNNSWSCPEFEGCDLDSLQPALQALRTAGLFVVASAGNEGPGCGSLNTPIAIYQEVLAVGAVGSSGDLAPFSSLGPAPGSGSAQSKPDLVAPGVSVLSSMPGSTYAENSGTSMAGPHAAGVAALIWSANPALIGNIDETERILKQSTRPYSGWLPDCPGADGQPSTAVGYGLLDAYEAVRLALESGDG